MCMVYVGVCTCIDKLGSTDGTFLASTYKARLALPRHLTPAT